MNPIRTKENFLIFGSPLVEEAEIEEVIACMRSAWIGTGPRVAQFENDFANYKGVQKAVALNSCTAALHLSYLVANLQPGDEVITTPLTFCATVNAIIHAGATPVLADIDGLTLNIDPNEIERRITPRTRAIAPVHFAGRACDMDAIMSIAQKYNLKVIEDCAHAIETEYKGRKAGTFGDFGCFSFYSTKNIVTGEGGMVIAKRDDDIARLKVLGLHGMSKDAWKRFGDEGFKHYQVVECGFKYNMMDMQAAIGIHQLNRVDTYWEKREKIWQQYMEAFVSLPIGLPSVIEANTRHAYHLYTILIDKEKTGISRDQFLDRMAAEGVGVGVHYLSLPEHPYYQHNFGWKPEDYPNAMRIGRQILSLPISAKLSEQDASDVVSAVKKIINA
jgi:dTDP-4-amino-4,6-dideoxygalactose transaminase